MNETRNVILTITTCESSKSYDFHTCSVYETNNKMQAQLEELDISFSTYRRIERLFDKLEDGLAAHDIFYCDKKGKILAAPKSIKEEINYRPVMAVGIAVTKTANSNAKGGTQ